MLNASVLKSNGVYQNIADIRKGDYVINHEGKCVLVKSNKKTKCTSHSKLFITEHAHWVNPLTMTPQIKLLCEEDGKFDWRPISTIDESKHQKSTYSVMPVDVSWDVPQTFHHDYGSIVLTPSYSLGYMFGVFIRNGLVNENNVVVFVTTERQQFVVDKICKYGHEIFGSAPVQMSLVHDGTDITYTCFDDNIITPIFHELYATSADFKKLPFLFRCSDLDYVRGLSEGLRQSSMFPPDIDASVQQNDYIYELTCWSTFACKKPVHYGSVVQRYNDVDYMCQSIMTRQFTTEKPCYVWNIQTDLSPNTFVANNLVVMTP